MPRKFRDLNTTEVDALNRSKTVILFPVGVMEDHGPHLPVGHDLNVAEGLCEELGETLEKRSGGWNTLIWPSAPLGVEAHTTSLAFDVRGYVLRDYLIDTCRGLGKAGFKHFVCVSGTMTPKQLTAVEEASKLMNFGWRMFGVTRNAKILSASSALMDGKEVSRSPLWPDALEHGGELDTSIALYFSPDTVASSHTNLIDVKRPGSFFGRFVSRLFGRTSGYWGAPSKASAEKGKNKAATWVEKISNRLEPILEGGRPGNRFRTWYSVLPPNSGFFKAWVMLALIVLMAIAWYWLFVDLLRY